MTFILNPNPPITPQMMWAPYLHCPQICGSTHEPIWTSNKCYNMHVQSATYMQVHASIRQGTWSSDLTRYILHSPDNTVRVNHFISMCIYTTGSPWVVTSCYRAWDPVVPYQRRGVPEAQYCRYWSCSWSRHRDELWDVGQDHMDEWWL